MRTLIKTLSAVPIISALLLSTLIVVGVAAAQDDPGVDPADQRADTFEAATGAQTENVPGGTLMIVAYGAVFILIFGYVASLAMRQNNTQRELDRLRQDLEAYRADAPPADEGA
ncbi:MAG: CcmD family protein [Sandaracinaceae bacterium]